MPAHSPAALNRLTRRLPSREAALIEPLFERVDLVFGDLLCDHGERVRHVFFPTSGVISLLGPNAEGATLELGLMGHDGVLGFWLAAGVKTAPLRALVQGNGTAFRIDARRFGRALEDCPTLTNRIHRYSYGLLLQVAQTAVCTCFHSIEARSARWMLSISDRMQSDDFTLTQSLLADMLGVRRAAVSQAARSFLGRGLITYTRGEVHIIDRTNLKALACSCYRVFDRLGKAV